MRSSSVLLATVLALVPLNGVLSAAALPKIDFPANSPVDLLSADYGESNETARGGALLLDFHAALSLRNASQRKIRGITLLVTAQDVTAGGKGSVTITSLDVGPQDTFPVRIDLRLLRPLQASSGVPVQIGLDGVLFDDLSFYGPDKLSSRRNMTAIGMGSPARPALFQIRAGVRRTRAAAAGNARKPDPRSGSSQFGRASGARRPSHQFRA